MNVPMALPKAPSFLLSIIFCLSTLFAVGILGLKPDCSKEIFITGDVRLSSPDSSSLIAHIDLAEEISLAETICFYVKPELNKDIFNNYVIEIEGDYNESYPLVYAFNLTDVTRTYSLSDKYTFAKPVLSYYCVCDCPGGLEHCTEETDNCANSPGPICVNVMADTSSNGCPLSFLSTTKTCCSVTVSPSDDYNRYIAFQLGNFETTFEFTLSSFYTRDGTVAQPPQHITVLLMGDSSTADEGESGISVTATTMDILDVPTSNLYSHEVGDKIMSDVEVNAIDELDFHKLGWFRVTNSTVSISDTTKLKEVVNVSVTNCLEDDYVVTPNVSYDTNDVRPWGSPLANVVGEQVASAVYNPVGPSARVKYQVSPRMTFELPLSTPAETFYQSGVSQLGDFSVESTEGGSILIINLTGSSGIISGNVQSGSQTDGYNILEDIHFMAPSSSSNEVIITLTLSTSEPVTRVCLHHILTPDETICRDVPLELTSMKIPPLPPQEHETMFPTEDATTSYITEDSNEQNDSQRNGQQRDIEKALKWYVISCTLTSALMLWII